MKRLLIGSDHAGFNLKQYIETFISKHYKSVEIVDVGTNDTQSCHYPDFA